MTLYGREQLHYQSINSQERIIYPIFAARPLLSNLAKLLNLWWDIRTLSQDILNDFLAFLSPCGYMKKTWIYNAKLDITVFLLVDFKYSFSFNIHFHFELSIILPLSVKLEVLGPPCGGRSHGWVIHCLPFQNENRVFARLFLQGGLGLLMGLRVGYRVCGYFPFRNTSIAAPFYQTR